MPLIATPINLTSQVQGALTLDLLREPYRSRVEAGAHPLTGHCYVASEALYHLLGGNASGLRPMCIQHEGGPHWWLRDAAGNDIDLTAAQFSSPVPYELGRGKGFLTSAPSKRAQVVIARVGGVAVDAKLARCARHLTAGASTCSRCRACCELRGTTPSPRKSGTTGGKRGHPERRKCAGQTDGGI